jgi:hypothetical protein
MTRLTALLLSLVLATLIAANSANYFFKHPMYETDDAASGSLAVDQAKHFAQLYGPYSRWGFYHPGPAFFYVQALGETLFFDTLEIVPAPFNAQSLVCTVVEAGFFIAVLQVFCQWLPRRGRWWFFPLAIALATLHFGDPFTAHPDAMRSCFAFQTTWSAHIVVLVFLSLLAASASVAAGRGEELPLLVLAGGCLVHEHVAQPMFVLPCALLAYAGLIGWYARAEDDPATPPGPLWHRALIPWQRQRRSHLVAGGILAIFLLPLAVDLTRGSQSNLAAILHHLRTYHGEHKPWLQSLLYFLQFGAYSSYVPGDDKFGAYNAPGMRRYLWAHAPVLAAWAAAYGLAAWALARQLLAWQRKRAGDPTGRFLAWAAIYLFLATVLTLKWGVIQDGEMYYYNAWFNFSIYFFALLIAAAVCLSWVLALLRRQPDVRLGWLEQRVAILAAGVCLVFFGQRLRIVDPSWSNNLVMHNSIARVMAASGAPNSVKFLAFPETTWIYAAAIALQLDRAGEPFTVSSEWQTMFGTAHAPKTDLHSLELANYQKWELVQPADAKSATEENRPLAPLASGVDLTVDAPAVVDLNNSGVTIFDFRQGRPAPDLEVMGWTSSAPWGEWTEGHRSILIFRAAPVDADVELTMDAFPFLAPTHGLKSQRLRVFCNGQQVGPELRFDRAEPPPVHITIPRVVWNPPKSGPASNIVMELQLPDAASPRGLDPATSDDPRELALGMRRMLWRELASESAAASAAGTGSRQAGSGPDLPAAYDFGGQTSISTACTGVFEDGWATDEVKVLLPMMAPSETPFLRLTGVAPQRTGIAYPYHFTAQAGSGPETDTMVQAPGPFDVFVPLHQAGNVLGNIEVRLDFPQTFVPNRTDPASRDDRHLSLLLHSLAITSAQDPVFWRYGDGWYLQESAAKSTWRWNPGEGSVGLAAARAGTLIITGTADTRVAGNAVAIFLDGAPVETLSLPTTSWQPFSVRIPLSAGEHMLTFRSSLPGVRPAGDTRIIAFGLRDVSCNLARPPGRN